MADGHTPKSRINVLNRGVTEGRVAELITAGVIHGMKQVYDQLAAEQVAKFQQLEDECTERVLRTLRERSLRFRLRRWFRTKILKRPLAQLSG